jgi:tryprostatin B 6-hydroxylase
MPLNNSGVTLTNAVLHRRLWSAAFSDKALRDYEQRIQGYRDKLVSQITAFSGQPVDISRWFNLYSFDVMGDLAFGSSFGMLEASDEHWAIKILNEGMDPLSFHFQAWFFRFMSAMPLLMRDWFKFVNYCIQRLNQRMNVRVTSFRCS